MNLKFRAAIPAIVIFILMVILFLGEKTGVFQISTYLEQLANTVRNEGIVPFCAVVIGGYIMKGFLPYPPFMVVTVLCCLLDPWIGIPLAIAGHVLGQAVACTHGSTKLVGDLVPIPAIVRRFLAWALREHHWFRIALAYFCCLPTDITQLVLRRSEVSRVKCVLCSIPFIAVVDSILVGSGGKGLALLLPLLRG